MSDVITQAIYRLFLGRGIRAEVTEEGATNAADRIEISVDLPALQVELEQAMVGFDILPFHVWLPLTTVVGGVPELVWSDTDGLVPTQVPIPHLGVEDATVYTLEGVAGEEEP